MADLHLQPMPSLRLQGLLPLAARGAARRLPRGAAAGAAATLCLILQWADPTAGYCGGCSRQGPSSNGCAELPSRKSASPSTWAAQRLRSVIPDIQHLAVEDVSDGHTAAGFADGSGRSLNPHGVELKVVVVAASFGSLKPLVRHRLVHEALREGLSTGAIHSLPKLRTWTPKEWQAAKTARGAARGMVAVALDEDWLGTVRASV